MIVGPSQILDIPRCHCQLRILQGNCNSEMEDATFTNISGYPLLQWRPQYRQHNIYQCQYRLNLCPSHVLLCLFPMNIAVSDVTITDSMGDGFSATKRLYEQSRICGY